jgi:hypothetical protein
MWEDWMVYLLVVLFFAQLLGYRALLISLEQKMTAVLTLLTQRKDMIIVPITESEIDELANAEAIREWDEG